jgi:osmotically-inducible protein OsmY
MTTTMTSVDESVRDAVMRQLAWEPDLDASLIGVSVQAGIVTLSGYADSFAAKLAAERAVRKLYGVKAIANELEVRLAQERIDPEIAQDAIDALRNHINVPRDISVTVRDGFVTLSGAAEWMFQKADAERAVKYLRGVRGVFNQIELRPSISARDVAQRITDALHRSVEIDARRIHVEADGGAVALTGTVRSWHEKDQAGRAAWAAPGVTAVDNRIDVVN